MIFASVGSMLPFERFVQGMDEWARDNPAHEVLIQIGAGKYVPQHAQWLRMMPHRDYLDRLRSSAVFVAHMGIGSMLQALEARKQMVLMTRRAALGEHTTDHQLHTAARFGGAEGVCVVHEVDEMRAAIDRLLAAPIAISGGLDPHAPPQMIARVAAFLKQDAGARRQ